MRRRLTCPYLEAVDGLCSGGDRYRESQRHEGAAYRVSHYHHQPPLSRRRSTRPSANIAATAEANAKRSGSTMAHLT